MNREQLKTIIWLRWRLTRNQWRRSRGVGPVLTALVITACVILAGMSLAGGLMVGVLGLRDVGPTTLHWVWFGITVAFLLFWMFGLVAELQRSETIDLQRLMHLPVGLGQMFTFNYVASHVTFSLLLFVPLILGLSVGLAISQSPMMLLLIPLGLGMVFMITAWTYCLRGWLAAMMTNPRRRRAIIMGMTLCLVLLGQAPNIYFNVVRRFNNPSSSSPRSRASSRQERVRYLNQLAALEKFVPPLWVPFGANALANGNPLPAIGGMVGCLAIGALGLRRAYRSTLRLYYGEIGGKAPEKVASRPEPATAAKSRSRLLEMTIPGVPEQAAAVATATFRSFMRAPEVKMAWATSFVVTLIAGASILLRTAMTVPPSAKPFIVVAPMAFSLMMLLQFLTNQFGFDREGFRALVLSPVDRKLILLGKNLAILPIAAGSSLLLFALTAYWLRLPPFEIAAGLFQLVSLLLLGAFGSNLLSILMPYRIQSGSIKPTKMPGLSMLVMVLCQFLFPLVMVPVLLPALAQLLWRLADLPPAMPVNLLLSLMLTLTLAFLYWITLEPIGRLLHRREITILGKVTAEVE